MMKFTVSRNGKHTISINLYYLFVFVVVFFVFNRGDHFRRAFSRLSEVCSIIPNSVKLMALTATAAVTTRTSICQILGMIEPSVVAVTPNQTNIYYSVEKKNTDVEETFTELVNEIRQKRLHIPRVIIFLSHL